MVIRVIVGGKAFPPPPPPLPSPGVSPSPSCLSPGNRILLTDRTWKPVEEIVVGDEVVTLNGRGHRVTKVDRTVLTAARGYVWISCNGRVVKLTDDHDLWVSHDDTEGWGTHNYNWWSYDAEKEGTLDVPAIPLQPYRYYDFAILEGWAPCMAEYVQGNPNDVVYGLELDGGGGFIAEGFVVIADRCRPEDIEGVEWNGV